MLDRAGIILSAVCLVHCVGLPFALAFLPSLAARVANSELVHHVLLVVLGLTAFLSFGAGYRVHHRASVLLGGVVGVSLLGVAVTLEGMAEPILTSLGGACLVCAHLANLRQCHGCTIDRSRLISHD